MFNSIFDGRVVAKLPFTPIYWVQGLSHRNLLGDDMTDCSFIFLYILCTMSIRQNIQKALGFAPSRAASKQAGSMWHPDPNKYKWWTSPGRPALPQKLLQHFFSTADLQEKSGIHRTMEKPDSVCFIFHCLLCFVMEIDKIKLIKSDSFCFHCNKNIQPIAGSIISSPKISRVFWPCTAGHGDLLLFWSKLRPESQNKLFSGWFHLDAWWFSGIDDLFNNPSE